MNDMGIFFTFLLTVFSAIAILARIKYIKFKEFENIMILLLVLFSVFMISWDIAIWAINLKLVQKGYLEVPKIISDKLSFGIILSTSIPVISFLYIKLIGYIFKPDSTLQ